MWSIPHTLFGVVLAFFVPPTRRGVYGGFAIVTGFALIWELFEYLTGVSTEEVATNSATDVIVAQLGFLVTAFLLQRVHNPQLRGWLFAIVACVWIAFEILGWLAYRHYVAAHS